MDETTDESVAVGTVLGTFFPAGGKPIGEVDRDKFVIAMKWQRLATYVAFAEVHGALAGMPLGYMAEMLGRAAAAGEQLGLALTAVRDAEVWRDAKPQTETDQRQESRRTIAGRALAETSGLWSISTGHAVVNVVARVVRAHNSSTYLDSKFGWGGRPKPFSETREFNLSLNASTVKTLRRAASETRAAPLEQLVHPLVELVKSPAWMALASRRDIGYHRWRPQSIDGGALTTNPWIDEGEGMMSLSVGLTSGHIPPEVERLVAESRAGHDALCSAMGDILAVLPEAMRSAGVSIWKVSDEPKAPNDFGTNES